MDWKRVIHKFLSDQTGATVVEYALILALIFFAMIAAFETFAGSFADLWTTASDVISSNMNG